MNENKVSYYTKFILRMVVAVACWLGLVHVLWRIQDLSVLVKSILLIGLLGAMILNIYNGRENRYHDFKQSLSKLENLDEGSFTYFIVRLYRTLGYYTQMPLRNAATKQKTCREVIVRKSSQEDIILLHCYNKEMSLQAVQELVGRLSSYKKPIKGQLITTGIVSDAVKQLATLNGITIIEKDLLVEYMKQAKVLLENDLDNALSAALCHPISWFYTHFLEAEPRFMHTANWQAWIILKLKNKGYQISKTALPETYGVHFVAQKGEEKLAIWCIGVEGSITLQMLQALKASLPYYTVTKGLVITNGKYTYKEKHFASQMQLELLNFNHFNKWYQELPEE